MSRLLQDMGKKGPERCAVGRAGSVADLPYHIKSIGGQKEACMRANGAKEPFYQWTNRLKGLESEIAWLPLYKSFNSN